METVVRKQAWSQFHLRWAGMKPPLRPHADVVKACQQLLQHHDEHILLLGVTPELSSLGAQLTALDRSQQMIDVIWPGNNSTRRAVQGNWLNPPFENHIFSAVVGDGALSCIHYPNDYRTLFQHMSRVVKPGGKMILRLFASPDMGETMDDVVEAILQHQIQGFHAFKWRVAMAIVHERKDPNIPVNIIHQAFNQYFPNRATLSELTGWSLKEIAEIDAYENSPEVYSFPTISQILKALPEYQRYMHIVPVGEYELAERCPLLVVDFPHE